jgi:modification methylase
MDDAAILEGDCFDLLPTLPERSVDLVFADPPYNLQLNGDLWRPNLTRVDAVDDAWDQFDGFGAYDDFTRAWLTEIRRVMRDTATIWISGTYHNIFRVGAILQDLDFWLLNTVTWWKPNAMPNFNGTRLKNDVEFVIWAKKHETSRYTFHHHLMKRFNDFSAGKQLGSVWKINVCGGEERLKDGDGHKLHATQKPEALLTRIIAASSNPGDLVLDPFSGTGTTNVVARRLHRRSIGIEREPAYIAAARDRLAAVTPLPVDDPLVTGATRPTLPRVPFRDLLTRGLLQPGDRLYLDRPAVEAVILADGALHVSDDLTGSIHQVGAQLKGAPSCNGWVHWYFIDRATGERRPLDDLRALVRGG